MTDIVAELRRLYAEAPQGEWEYSGPFNDGDSAGYIEVRDSGGDWWPVVGIGIDRPEVIHLIVAMHNHLPQLLDVVEAARSCHLYRVAAHDEFYGPDISDDAWLVAEAKLRQAREQLDAALAALERSGE